MVAKKSSHTKHFIATADNTDCKTCFHILEQRETFFIVSPSPVIQQPKMWPYTISLVSKKSEVVSCFPWVSSQVNVTGQY